MSLKGSLQKFNFTEKDFKTQTLQLIIQVKIINISAQKGPVIIYKFNFTKNDFKTQTPTYYTGKLNN